MLKFFRSGLAGAERFAHSAFHRVDFADWFAAFHCLAASIALAWLDVSLSKNRSLGVAVDTGR